MATYDLLFVAIDDVSANIWGGPADLTQGWIYGNTLTDITFTNPSTLSVVDDDPNFDDDDGRAWNPTGNTTGDLQITSDGMLIEPEFTYKFTDTNGNTYEAIVVYEVDAAGNGVRIIGFTFADPPHHSTPR